MEILFGGDKNLTVKYTKYLILKTLSYHRYIYNHTIFTLYSIGQHNAMLIEEHFFNEVEIYHFIVEDWNRV